MSKRLAGLTVSSSEVNVVVLDYSRNSFTLIDAQTLRLQKGDRPAAYRVLADQLTEHLKSHEVECACVKGSALSLGGTKKVHLESAELRGVTLCVASGVCEVQVMLKSTASRTFGERKVDEYLKDSSFWAGLNLAGLAKGMREAAFSAIAQFHST